MNTNLCSLLAARILLEHPELKQLLRGLQKVEGGGIVPPVTEQAPDAFLIIEKIIVGSEMSPAELGIIMAAGRSHDGIYGVAPNDFGISIVDVIGAGRRDCGHFGGRDELEFIAIASLMARIVEMVQRSAPIME